jgi:hypothetical protein
MTTIFEIIVFIVANMSKSHLNQVPDFLQPLMNEILSASKDLEVLQKFRTFLVCEEFSENRLTS